MENKHSSRKNHPRSSSGPPAPTYLLLLGCSESKRVVKGKYPALDLYDGVNFRVLRRFLRAYGWPSGLRIRILSGKYGLIDATKLIQVYDRQLTPLGARAINRSVIRALTSIGQPASVFVNLGSAYLPAIKGINDVFKSKVTYAQGGIGTKMAMMKKWLESLPHAQTTLRGKASGRSYLYFLPDWDDYVRHPFVHEMVTHSSADNQRKVYAHELFGPKSTPYDGVLISLAQIHSHKGVLARIDPSTARKNHLRSQLKLPKHLLLVGDCGAFSYAAADEPPFTPEEAAALYDRLGFDMGASVDHIPLVEVLAVGKDGQLARRQLSEGERRRRIRLTVENAERFLETWRRNRYGFAPLGVVQGLGVRSYVNYARQYIDMGYQHIALGGLVPRSDGEIVAICCAVRAAIQAQGVQSGKNVWLHLFGILRPKIQAVFRLMGVSSFDSASYLRKAWLRSDQNYLAPDGGRWYSAIRVPMSSSKRLRATAERKKIQEADLLKMESKCLQTLHAFDGTATARLRVINAVNEYGPLLERRGEDNHFVEKHEELLRARPWETCRCPICRGLGIDVAVFRGAGRNKRRGFHNTWVLYNKILHGK